MRCTQDTTGRMMMRPRSVDGRPQGDTGVEMSVGAAQVTLYNEDCIAGMAQRLAAADHR